MQPSVIYTDDIDSKFGGFCEFPSLLMRLFNKPCVIKIRPKYKDDLGLLKHEVKHVEQFNADYFYGLKYKFLKSFRYKTEIAAYTEQIKEYRYTDVTQAKWIIDALCYKYNLGVNKDTINKDIIKVIRRLNN